MFNRLLLYLRLVRVPNGFTAMADSVAGYLVVSRLCDVSWFNILMLLLVSLFLYSAGIVLNDLCDVEIDSKLRPFRLLPSGVISLIEAKIIIVVLYVLGLSISFFIGIQVFYIALALCLCIFLYDRVFKKNIYIAPLIMGLCRFFNFVLGMSAIDSFVLDNFWLLFYPFVMLGYVCLLTYISRFEFFVKKSRWIAVVLILWVVVSYMGGYCFGLLPQLVGVVLCLGFLCMLILLVLSNPKIDVLIKFLILGIVLLDGVLVAGVSGFLASILVIVFFIPAVLLSFYFKMT